MSAKLFWKDWKRNYRGIYVMLLFVLFLICISTFLAYLFGLEWYAPLETVRKTESININLNSVKDFVFDIPINVRNYVVFQGFLNFEASIHPSLPYIFSGIVSLFLAFILASATYFNRLWFMVFQAIAVIWIVTLNLPATKILGLTSQLTTFVGFGAFLLLGYYYHAFKTEASLGLRFATFTLLEVVLLSLVHWLGEREGALLFISQNTSIIAIILAIVFVFNVAYEVILILVYLLARNKNEGNSNLTHFLIFGLLYLAYLILVFAKNNYLIRLDIVYLNEFLLLFISSILGIWGFKKRTEFIQSQIEFRPIGAYLYLAFGIICFTTIAWIFFTANDPLIDTFEDVINYSHIGFGAAFFFYVLFNFSPLLKKGLSVYPIVTRPSKYPFYIFRFLGLIIVALLVLRSNYLPYYQAVSGYYNAVGDYYELVGNEEAALNSYKVGRQYASTNRRSNLKIANQYFKEENWAQATYFYDFAHYKEPSLQSILNQAQTELNAGLEFDAIKKLNKAPKEYKNSAQVINMKGLIFEELNIIDSAIYYFDLARQLSDSEAEKAVFESNYLALLSKNNLEPDSLIYINRYADPAYEANFLAMLNRKREKASSFGLEDPFSGFEDSVLTYNTFSNVYNFTLNQSFSKELADSSKINKFLKANYNEAFHKPLRFSLAYSYYYSGNVREAFTHLNELEEATISDAGKYFLIHALWLYEQGAYQESYKKLDKAEQLKISKANTYKVLNLIKQNKLYEANLKYEKQFEGKSIDTTYIINDPLNQFLAGKLEDLPENFLYLWLSKNKGLTAKDKADIIQRLESSFYLKLHMMDSAQRLIDEKKPALAKELLKSIEINTAEHELLKKREELKLLLNLKSNAETLNEINANLLSESPKNFSLLYQAMIASGEQAETADSLAYAAGTFNSYFTESVIFGTNHFLKSGQKDLAYEIITRALRINKNSIPLLKKYILTCLENNLRSYANDALDELSLELTEDEYLQFKKEYDELLKELATVSW